MWVDGTGATVKKTMVIYCIYNYLEHPEMALLRAEMDMQQKSIALSIFNIQIIGITEAGTLAL